MFDTVLKTLFPSKSDSEVSARLDHLQRTRKVAEKVTGQSAADTLEKDTKRFQIQQGVSPLFYSYLFASSDKDEADQELTIYISQRVRKVINKPKLLLEALPAMPESVSKVIDVLQDEDFNINELLALIEREPSMAGDLIKLANSARYFRGDKPVSDIRVAFTFMGSQGLMDGVLQVFLKQFSVSTHRHFKQFGTRIWEHSFRTALHSQQIAAERLGIEQKGVGYFVGLIRNLGYMVLFQLISESFKFVRPDAKPCTETLINLLEQYSMQITGLIAEHWQLPNEVKIALAHQKLPFEQSEGVAKCVQEGNLLSQYIALIQAGLADEKTVSHEYLSSLNSKTSQQIITTLTNPKLES